MLKILLQEISKDVYDNYLNKLLYIKICVHKYNICSFIIRVYFIILNAPIFFGYNIEKNKIISVSNNVYNIHNYYLFNIIYLSFVVY